MSGTPPKASPFAQRLWEEGFRERRSVISRVRHRIVDGLRRQLMRNGEPLIEYVLDGTPLLLPMSHPLPLYRREYPQYSSNVGRIAAAVAGNTPDFSFIDIGANVGDTLAIVRANAEFPVLCIEGAEQYLPVLRSNALRFADVEIEPTFVGVAEQRAFAVAASDGTARLVKSEGGSIGTNFLTDIVARHPRFARPSMIKLDTDGMDTLILKNEVPFLTKTQPVVFFEYDPYFFAAHDRNGFEVFEELRVAGYGPLLVYNNVGDLICQAHVRERELLRDLNEFYSGREGRQYADICAFPEYMAPLCREIHESELEFFRAARAQAGGAA